jgi:hypothetical protein
VYSSPALHQDVIVATLSDSVSSRATVFGALFAGDCNFGDGSAEERHVEEQLGGRLGPDSWKSIKLGNLGGGTSSGGDGCGGGSGSGSSNRGNDHVAPSVDTSTNSLEVFTSAAAGPAAPPKLKRQASYRPLFAEESLPTVPGEECRIDR